MYARVSRYEVPTDRIDEDVAGAADTQAKVSSWPGSMGLYYLVDRETGRTMSITLWETEEDMRRSEDLASGVREETSSAVGAHLFTVERYEVATQPAMVPAGRR